MASIHRFHLPPGAEGALALTGREAHHALDVLRLRPGAPVVVLDGAGHEYQCEIRGVSKNRAELAVLQKKFTPPPPCQITLCQAVPKGKTMETIVEKATELGAARVVPLLTERTVVQLDAGEAASKVEKWRQVAIEAIKQCGSPWLPHIELPVTLPALLKRPETFDLKLVASLQPDSVSPREHFQDFRAAQQRQPASVGVWVGPEGDFTSEEYQAIQAAGARPITLGPLVLRADTAAIYCLSVLNYELQSARPTAG